MLKTLTRAGIVVAMAAVLQVQPAAAYPRHHHHHYRHDSYAYDRHVRNCRTGGTVLGVAGGALVGNAITHH
ncbi:MAG TPA: hypothetical protein VG943_06805, partial [Caulobacterales bacterium]|nr:hypothetical protein [Caulobacterales bacterium]